MSQRYCSYSLKPKQTWSWRATSLFDPQVVVNDLEGTSVTQGGADSITPNILILNPWRLGFLIPAWGVIFVSSHWPCQHGFFRSNSQVDIPDWNWAWWRAQAKGSWEAGRWQRTSHTLQRMFVLSVTQAAMESSMSYFIFALRNTLVSMENELDCKRERVEEETHWESWSNDSGCR